MTLLIDWIKQFKFLLKSSNRWWYLIHLLDKENKLSLMPNIGVEGAYHWCETWPAAMASAMQVVSTVFFELFRVPRMHKIADLKKLNDRTHRIQLITIE